jgi:thiamine kinase-like enzyme
LPEELLPKLETTLSFDIEKEDQWFQTMESKVANRLVFSHNDLNPANLLLKTDQKPGSGLFDNIMLIDSEYCGMHPPGADLANYMIQRSYFYANLGYPLSDIPPPTTAELTIAVRAYIKESNKIFGNNLEEFDDDEKRLLREVEAFMVGFRLTTYGLGCRFVALMGATGFLHYTAFNVEQYRASKKAFLAKYPELA